MSKTINSKIKAISIAMLFFGALLGIFSKSTKDNALPPTTQTGQITYYQVVKIVDGDTIDVNINGQTERVRLIGIDTPETVKYDSPVECFGPEATAKAKELLLNKQVRLETDSTQDNRDTYDRLLRYVYRDDGLFFNQWMIKNGYAREFTFIKPYKYQTKFKQDEIEAKDGGLGLWEDGVCDHRSQKSIKSQSL